MVARTLFIAYLDKCLLLIAKSFSFAEFIIIGGVNKNKIIGDIE